LVSLTSTADKKGLFIGINSPTGSGGSGGVTAQPVVKDATKNSIKKRIKTPSCFYKKMKPIKYKIKKSAE
jgi:hypothetical protein